MDIKGITRSSSTLPKRSLPPTNSEKEAIKPPRREAFKRVLNGCFLLNTRRYTKVRTAEKAKQARLPATDFAPAGGFVEASAEAACLLPRLFRNEVVALL